MHRVIALLALTGLIWSAASCGGNPAPEPAPGSFATDTARLLFDGSSESIAVVRVSEESFTSAVLQPMFGRNFVETDYLPDAPPLVILHHDFWERRLRGDLSVVGSTLDVNGQATTVVGVMPKGLNFPEGGRLLLPRHQ